MSEPEYGAWEREMETLLAQAQALTVNGRQAMGNDPWKWAMGDTIAQMQALVKRTQERVLEPAVHTTLEVKAAARKCRDQYKAFLPDAKQHKHQRDVLVDYAAVAGKFPPASPVRTELSHSHARALARVKVPEARATLTEQAIRLGWSVARIQAEINAAGRVPADCTDSKDRTPGGWARTQNSTWVCAQTGRSITNRETMVELHIQPESTLDAILKRETKRGGAAKKKRNGEPPDAPRILRFATALDLLTWLAACQDATELKAVGQPPVTGLPEKKGGQVIVWPGFKKSLTETFLENDMTVPEAVAEKPMNKSRTGEGNTDDL